MPRTPETKSAERRAFEHYLRTGRRLAPPASALAPERKFNPYHDPRNGRFTFAPGGPKSLQNALFSDRRGRWKPKLAGPPEDVAELGEWPASGPGDSNLEHAVLTDQSAATLQRANHRPNPRARIGGNGGPPLSDPVILQNAVPGLRSAPAGAILAIPDAVLDFTGPAQAAIATIHNDYANALIRQIQSVDPKYKYHGTPVDTFAGRVQQTNTLRLDRAFALYRIRNDERALQLELLRFVQARVDAAYERGVPLYEAGKLEGRSRNNAIGRYVDGEVRRELRQLLNWYRMDHEKGPLRVNRRQYDTSGTEPTFVVPDAVLPNLDIDWTLQRKTIGRKQVRGFFSSDEKPKWTAIIRPRQLGHSYILTTPRR